MKKTLALLTLALSCLASPVTGVMAQNVPPNVVKELAPNGKLRAAINFGNIVLAQKDPAGGEPRGVSGELARELAKRLGVPIEYVTFDAAGKVFDALKAGAWDVAFLAIDPVRSEGIEFTGPYVVIEGAYLVPANSPLQTNEDVDRDGVRVAVARGSAYDLYLTRALKRAQLVREQSGPQALDMFLKDRLEAAAGTTEPAEHAGANRRRLAPSHARGVPKWTREWVSQVRRVDRKSLAWASADHFAGEGGATAASVWPLFSSALATKPEAFISSMNSRR